MPNFEINFMSVILATVASMALGMAWYIILEKQWIKATGKNKEDLISSIPSVPFIWAAVGQFIMAVFIYKLTGMLFENAINIKNTVHTGMLMWFGFILTSMIINHRYQNMSWKLTLIDGGYLLGAVITQGVVLGIFG